MRRLGITVVLSFVVLPVPGIHAWQAAQKLEYDAFCKLPDVETKRSAFLATSAESRTELARTQVERWRDANRGRLNEKQLAALAELIAAFGPDTYADGAKGEEARAKIRPLAEKQRQLFAQDELSAMQPYGPCIAKVK